MIFIDRAAGILMHISSLPEKYGIGTFGREAFSFVDFLKKSGQTYWQVLPLNPTGFGNSPYQSCSAHALNPYFIDLDLLCNENLLDKNICDSFSWDPNFSKVNYENLFKNRFTVLKIAFENFKKSHNAKFEEFISKNHSWLENYSVFMAIKTHLGNISFQKWPPDLIFQEKSSLNEIKTKLKDNIDFFKFLQFKAYSQWESLKNYANSQNIKIIGDLAIYVGFDSADVWGASKNFLLDKNLNPICVAGCPPDSFSEKGQFWGNPLYDWEYLKKNEYKWWIDRLTNAASLFDVFRIDHFRGFDSYYAIEAKETDASNGTWEKGPGIDFFNAVKEKLGNISIIAEDLGFLTDSVISLLEKTKFPGMKILEFAFDKNPLNPYLPNNYNKNSVAYTGTHDNDTLVGWFNSLSKDIQNQVKKYALLSDKKDLNNLNWELIRLVYSSKSNLAIIPMQDFLGLGSDARLNIPSTLENNWVWRVQKNSLNEDLSKKIKNFTNLYSR